MSFHQKSVLITGGASGMGAACARLFAAEGAHVLIVDRNATLAHEVATAIGAGEPMIGDVSDSAFCDQAVATAMQRHGRVDALVNAAGTIVRGDALATDDEAWFRILNVNLSGMFFMSRAALRPMKTLRMGYDS